MLGGGTCPHSWFEKRRQPHIQRWRRRPIMKLIDRRRLSGQMVAGSAPDVCKHSTEIDFVHLRLNDVHCRCVFSEQRPIVPQLYEYSGRKLATTLFLQCAITKVVIDYFTGL